MEIVMVDYYSTADMKVCTDCGRKGFEVVYGLCISCRKKREVKENERRG